MSPEPRHHCSNHGQPAPNCARVLYQVCQNIIHAHPHFHKPDSHSCHPSHTGEPAIPLLLPLRFAPHARLQVAFSATHTQARATSATPARPTRRMPSRNRRTPPTRRLAPRASSLEIVPEPVYRMATQFSTAKPGFRGGPCFEEVPMSAMSQSSPRATAPRHLWFLYVLFAFLGALVTFVGARAQQRASDDATFRKLIDNYCAAWSSGNTANAAKFYSKEDSLIFYDLSPFPTAAGRNTTPVSTRISSTPHHPPLLPPAKISRSPATATSLGPLSPCTSPSI